MAYKGTIRKCFYKESSPNKFSLIVNDKDFEPFIGDITIQMPYKEISIDMVFYREYCFDIIPQKIELNDGRIITPIHDYGFSTVPIVNNVYTFLRALYGDVFYSEPSRRNYSLTIFWSGNSKRICMDCNRIVAKRCQEMSNYEVIERIKINTKDEYDIPYTEISLKSAMKFFYKKLQRTNEDGSFDIGRGWLCNESTNSPLFIGRKCIVVNGYYKDSFRVYSFFDVVNLYKEEGTDWGNGYYNSINIFLLLCDFLPLYFRNQSVKISVTSINRISTGFYRSRSQEEREIYLSQLLCLILNAQSKLQRNERNKIKRSASKH